MNETVQDTAGTNAAENGKNYPLYAMRVYANPNDFNMNSVNMVRSGWRLHSFQAVTPPGDKYHIAVIWVKNKRQFDMDVKSAYPHVETQRKEEGE